MMTVSPDVVWIDGDGEVRLYDAVTGEFQTLNDSAAEIWRRLAGGASPAEVEAALVAEFAAGDPHEAKLIASDIEEFVATLTSMGLMRETPSC